MRHPAPIALLLAGCLATFACQTARGPAEAPLTAPDPDEGAVGHPGADPGTLDPRGEQRAANQACWEEHGGALAAEHAGDWVLIAGGSVRGHWSAFEAAWSAAEGLRPPPEHAFLYRAGVDDQETTFVLSPFLGSSPRWMQLGIRIRRPWKLTIAAAGDTWYRGDRQVSWGDAGARLVISAPGGGLVRSVRAVASNLFEFDLTLRPVDAETLGLGRYTAPGPAFLYDRSNRCDKVVLRVKIPELDVDVPAVAFVLPADPVR